MVAMVEMQLNSTPSEGEKISYVVFAVITTLLIATHMFSLLISTCILPSLEVATPGTSGLPRELRSSLAPESTPYESMKIFIEVAWVCSTGFGILLFFVEVGILSWVKFFNTANVAAYASIGLVIPIFFMFTVFAFKFYQQMVKEKFEEERTSIRELERLNLEIKLKEKEEEDECLKGVVAGGLIDDVFVASVGGVVNETAISSAVIGSPAGISGYRAGWKGWSNRMASTQIQGSHVSQSDHAEVDQISNASAAGAQIIQTPFL